MEQLEIFLYPKSIPDDISDAFLAANAGQYRQKQDFYTLLKEPILKMSGKFAGYDLQVIKRRCLSCHGTGMYTRIYGKEPCYSCSGTGIYSTNYFTLERYILNGHLYHLPNFGKRGDVVYVNHFDKVLEHIEVDYNQALKGFLAVAIWYREDIFYDQLRDLIKSNGFLKNKELVDYAQSLITAKNEELPF